MIFLLVLVVLVVVLVVLAVVFRTGRSSGKPLLLPVHKKATASTTKIMYPPHDLQMFRLDFAVQFSKDPPGSLPVDSRIP